MEGGRKGLQDEGDTCIKDRVWKEAGRGFRMKGTHVYLWPIQKNPTIL